jgi:phosphate transport system permease protein
MTISRRHATEKIITVLCLLATLAVVGTLFMIIGQVFIAGLPSLSWYFITTPENAANGLGAGIANAIVGTILISFCATIVAGPFGFGTAVYMKRYAADNGITRAFRFLLEVLSGTPSVVIGIFGFLIFVIYLKQITGGFSLIAGTLALAILIMPVIERSIEDAIDRVSPELEEGSYSLGANKWQTIRGITIPTAFTGILTGLSLGFGRAAEESAIVLLTAGYTQYMPELGIQSVKGALGGVKIYPLQDSVGTLPYDVYHNFASAGLAKPSSGFAAAFVLIVLVFTINIMGKAVLSYGFGSGKSNNGSFLGSVKKRLFPPQKTGATPIDPATYQTSPLVKSSQKEVSADPLKKDPSIAALRSAPVVPVDLSPLIPSHPSNDTQPSKETDTTMPVPPASEPPKPARPRKKILSAGADIARLFNALRQKVRILVHDNREKKAPGNAATVHDIAAPPASVRTSHPFNSGRIIGSVRSFLVTLAPFALVAAILMVLTILLPALSPVGSNGPAGFLTVPIMALILCIIGTVSALFLVRNSTLFLLRHRKGRIGNRRAEFAAIALGFCMVLIAASLFSAHIFSPASPAMVSNSPAGSGVFSLLPLSGNGGLSGITDMIQDNNLLGFLHGSGSTAANSTASSSRSAQLAAFLASEETPAEVPVQSTPAAPRPSPAPSSPAQVSSTEPAVPVKNALDVGESYWYGDNSRPCLATIYNVTVLPFYFYWDMDWNRFVQVTPVSTGDMFLVVFIRIEDTANMSAIVPPASEFIVSYNGQTYSNNPYFDTSVISQNEYNIYSTNFNAMPYQWIREIGQQKRDYAFLTGYDIFGQNTTVVSNYTANSAYSPPSASNPNGEGYFIKPGSSNAIDGYLIYEVPGSAAADLRDTYVQVSFNSFSPTQWRLGK